MAGHYLLDTLIYYTDISFFWSIYRTRIHLTLPKVKSNAICRRIGCVCSWYDWKCYLRRNSNQPRTKTLTLVSTSSGRCVEHLTSPVLFQPHRNTQENDEETLWDVRQALRASVARIHRAGSPKCNASPSHVSMISPKLQKSANPQSREGSAHFRKYFTCNYYVWRAGHWDHSKTWLLPLGALIAKGRNRR